MTSLRNNAVTPTRSYSNYSSDSLRRNASPAGLRDTRQREWDSHFNALLADLQNTISPSSGGGNHVSSPSGGLSSGYGSLNGTRGRDPAGGDRGEYGTTRSVERYENHSQPAVSPTYQNQRVIHETTTSSKSQPLHGTPGTKTGSLNNNLSELDTLLQDLSNARYAGTTERRDLGAVNGSPTNSYGGRPPSQESRSRPSVDSLLEELNTAVPNGDGHITRTITIHETQTDSGYPGYSHAVGNGASSATKELDDLMASLSDFKFRETMQSEKNQVSSHQLQTVTDSPYAKPNKATKSSPSPQPIDNYHHSSITTTTVVTKQNQLDSMLGNLQADMSRQGVNTTQKGCCNACDKAIVGQVITALGKTWHPEHFTCTHCNQELGTRNFFERDGHPYCEPDYHNLFSPRCAYCNGPILDKCVTALEKTWHTEHFFCAQCGKQFGEDGFHEREGKPYCRDDYFDMFAPKCGGCNRPIMENYISALNSQWHGDCFVCRDCRQPFHGGSFFDHEGLPYCETHYHAKRGSLCAGCHKPITGRCITAMFRKFHPEHFVCAFCLKQLNKGTFKEQNDKPYCHGCFDKLFG